MTTAMPPESEFSPILAADLTTVGPAQPWLWRGFLAPENITLFTSQWKAGKTTLLAILIERMKAGGQLAGLPVQPGKVAVVTEEGPSLWAQRAAKFDYGENACWFCQPFPGKPTRSQFDALVTQLLAMRR